MRSSNLFVAAAAHGNSMLIRCAVDDVASSVLQHTDRLRSWARRPDGELEHPEHVLRVTRSAFLGSPLVCSRDPHGELPSSTDASSTLFPIANCRWEPPRTMNAPTMRAEMKFGQ